MTSSDEGARSSAAVLMRSVLQRVATGPELSKSISREEACGAMAAILDGEVSDVQAAVFLIALRMKRETDDENLGVLDAILDRVDDVVADVDDVLDVSDPYNGFNRNLPVAPFLPAVLAACGLPAVCHGVERVGPKNGATHRQVIAAAGGSVDSSPVEAASRLADPAVGWGYVDQAAYSPKLYGLLPLRNQIIKRATITTVEVMCGPVRGRRRTHLMTGYVHKPYPRVYALLARAAAFDTALLVRGVEGGVIPSLNQKGKVWRYESRGEEVEVDILPEHCGISRDIRSVPLPEGIEGYRRKNDAGEDSVDARAIAHAAAQTGRETLDGAEGPARDSLIYAGALALWHTGRSSTLTEAADRVRQALDSGDARRHFEV